MFLVNRCFSRSFLLSHLAYMSQMLHVFSALFSFQGTHLKRKNGRGSWTRTNACGIQNPVPYQLGDTPVFWLSLSTNAIIRTSDSIVNPLFYLFRDILRDVFRKWNWQNPPFYGMLTVTWGCNGLDGDRWYRNSELRGSRTGSVRDKLLLNIKANEEYALAA